MNASPKNNVILFTGDSSAALRKNLSAWTASFVEKYGDMNVATVRIGETQPSSVATELLSTPFFAEKRLVIFEGVPRLKGKNAAASDDEDSPSEDNATDPAAQIEAAVLSVFDSIPDSTVAIFISETPAKVSALYKKLCAEGTVKTFAAMDEASAKAYIVENLPGITPRAMLALYDRVFVKPDKYRGIAWGLDERKLRTTVEKLYLGYGDSRISEKEVEEAEPQSSDLKAFSIGDHVIRGDMVTAMSTVRTLLAKESPFAVLPSIIWTVRNRLHIEFLRRAGKQNPEIAEILAGNAFMISKADRMTDPEFRNSKAAYAALVKFETAWRTGNAPGEDEAEQLELGVMGALLAWKKQR